VAIFVRAGFFFRGDSTGAHSSSEAMLGSSIPSAKLEQAAQMFGFRDKALPFSAIRSPQQMQTLGFIDATEVVRRIERAAAHQGTAC
jgi:hypothetical protein